MSASRQLERQTGEQVPPPGQAAPITYYDYPTLKQPKWGWEIILYFFLGGLASGAYLVATLVDLLGKPEDRVVARAGRYVALVSVMASPILLILDLGRRKRFTHMMRIVKSRSPMSMGTWGLSAFGLFVGLGALRQAVLDGIVGEKSLVARLLAWVPMPVSGVLGSLAAFFVGSYTGVLLSFTNVPVWAKNHLLQGPLFLTSSLATGLSSISLALSFSKTEPRGAREWLRWAETAATLGELGLLVGTLFTLGRQARPLLRRPYALPFWLGFVVLGLLVPLALRWNPGPQDRRSSVLRDVIASLSVLAGGLLFRTVTVLAGRESVEDPREYFAFTRAGRKPA